MLLLPWFAALLLGICGMAGVSRDARMMPIEALPLAVREAMQASAAESGYQGASGVALVVGLGPAGIPPDSQAGAAELPDGAAAGPDSRTAENGDESGDDDVRRARLASLRGHGPPGRPVRGWASPLVGWSAMGFEAIGVALPPGGRAERRCFFGRAGSHGRADHAAALLAAADGYAVRSAQDATSPVAALRLAASAAGIEALPGDEETAELDAEEGVVWSDWTAPTRRASGGGGLGAVGAEGWSPPVASADVVVVTAQALRCLRAAGAAAGSLPGEEAAPLWRGVASLRPGVVVVMAPPRGVEEVERLSWEWWSLASGRGAPPADGGRGRWAGEASLSDHLRVARDVGGLEVDVLATVRVRRALVAAATASVLANATAGRATSAEEVVRAAVALAGDRGPTARALGRATSAPDPLVTVASHAPSGWAVACGVVVLRPSLAEHATRHARTAEAVARAALGLPPGSGGPSGPLGSGAGEMAERAARAEDRRLAAGRADVSDAELLVELRAAALDSSAALPAMEWLQARATATFAAVETARSIAALLADREGRSGDPLPEGEVEAAAAVGGSLPLGLRDAAESAIRRAGDEVTSLVGRATRRAGQRVGQLESELRGREAHRRQAGEAGGEEEGAGAEEEATAEAEAEEGAEEGEEGAEGAGSGLAGRGEASGPADGAPPLRGRAPDETGTALPPRSVPGSSQPGSTAGGGGPPTSPGSTGADAGPGRAAVDSPADLASSALPVRGAAALPSAVGCPSVVSLAPDGFPSDAWVLAAAAPSSASRCAEDVHSSLVRAWEGVAGAGPGEAAAAERSPSGQELAVAGELSDGRLSRLVSLTVTALSSAALPIVNASLAARWLLVSDTLAQAIRATSGGGFTSMPSSNGSLSLGVAQVDVWGEAGSPSSLGGSAGGSATSLGMGVEASLRRLASLGTAFGQSLALASLYADVAVPQPQLWPSRAPLASLWHGSACRLGLGGSAAHPGFQSRLRQVWTSMLSLRPAAIAMAAERAHTVGTATAAEGAGAAAAAPAAPDSAARLGPSLGAVFGGGVARGGAPAAGGGGPTTLGAELRRLLDLDGSLSDPSSLGSALGSAAGWLPPPWRDTEAAFLAAYAAPRLEPWLRRAAVSWHLQRGLAAAAGASGPLPGSVGDSGGGGGRGGGGVDSVSGRRWQDGLPPGLVLLAAPSDVDSGGWLSGRPRLLVVCAQWRRGHSVHRNFGRPVRAMARGFASALLVLEGVGQGRDRTRYDVDGFDGGAFLLPSNASDADVNDVVAWARGASAEPGPGEAEAARRSWLGRAALGPRGVCRRRPTARAGASSAGVRGGAWGLATDGATSGDVGWQSSCGGAEGVGRWRFDLVVWPQVGMHPFDVPMATRRLGPVQVASYGHPVSSRIPAVDGFVVGWEGETGAEPSDPARVVESGDDAEARMAELSRGLYPADGEAAAAAARSAAGHVGGPAEWWSLAPGGTAPQGGGSAAPPDPGLLPPPGSVGPVMTSSAGLRSEAALADLWSRLGPPAAAGFAAAVAAAPLLPDHEDCAAGDGAGPGGGCVAPWRRWLYAGGSDALAAALAEDGPASRLATAVASQFSERVLVVDGLAASFDAIDEAAVCPRVPAAVAAAADAVRWERDNDDEDTAGDAAPSWRPVPVGTGEGSGVVVNLAWTVVKVDADHLAAIGAALRVRPGRAGAACLASGPLRLRTLPVNPPRATPDPRSARP